MRQSVEIPVLANGDITSFQKANEVKKITGCNSLMIGRGAVGNPWIFYQLKEKKEQISQDIKKTIILEHYDSMIDFYGERGVSMFRKHLHTYSKGIEGASEFRNQINTVTNVQLMKKIIEEFF